MIILEESIVFKSKLIEYVQCHVLHVSYTTSTKSRIKVFFEILVHQRVLIMISDVDGVFSAYLGNLQPTTSRYSGMWISWRTLSSINTG